MNMKVKQLIAIDHENEERDRTKKYNKLIDSI